MNDPYSRRSEALVLLFISYNRTNENREKQAHQPPKQFGRARNKTK